MSIISAREGWQTLHDKASPREWRSTDEGDIQDLWAGPHAIAAFHGQNARADIELVVRLRNTLPEVLRSMDNREHYIRYLEDRVRVLEEQVQGHGHRREV